MTDTVRVACPAGQWTALSNGQPNVLAQMVMAGEVEVLIATTAPANNAAQVGHILSGANSSISFAQLTMTDRVFVRPANGQANSMAVTR
jgi:hypothetical protein